MWARDSILKPWWSGAVWALSISETWSQSMSLPRVTSTGSLAACPSCLYSDVLRLSTATLTYSSTGTSAHTPPPCPLPHFRPPPHPSTLSNINQCASYRWSSQALTWAATNLFMVCYRRVLIQTAETTLTAQPTMEEHGGCRGMPKDVRDDRYLNSLLKCLWCSSSTVSMWLNVRIRDIEVIFYKIQIQHCSFNEIRVCSKQKKAPFSDEEPNVAQTAVQRTECKNECDSPESSKKQHVASQIVIKYQGKTQIENSNRDLFTVLEENSALKTIRSSAFIGQPLKKVPSEVW